MADYSHATKRSISKFMALCIPLCLLVSVKSNAVQNDQDKSNDFYVSITVINGKIHVNWNTSSLWQNTTVYFLSSFSDNITNTFHAVNISVCHAFTLDKVSWNIEANQDNLLKFCNRSRRCRPMKDNDLLVSAEGSKELSCQLFPACSNFEDVFRIHVVSKAEGKEYSFESGNMTILSENIPPYKRLGEDQDQVMQDTHITITLKYFHPSELCGFGARPMDNLEFVFNCYKVNDSKCFFMGQKTASYTGQDDEVNFSDFVIGNSEVWYFDIVVKSLASNKTSPSQRLKFLRSDTSTKTCSVIGGVVYISWRPQWNCFDEEIIEQAEFCFDKDMCRPACEASFFANGTLRTAVADQKSINDSCSRRKSDCSTTKLIKGIEFINVTWSPQTQRISCALFRTCMDYRNHFTVKAFSLNKQREKVNTLFVCYYTHVALNSKPTVPRSVNAVNVQAHQMTITWKSTKCELDLSRSCEVHLLFDGADSVVEVGGDVTRSSDGLNYIYMLTKKKLTPFKDHYIQLFTKCGNHGSKRSPLKLVRTKMSAPSSTPRINNIQARGPDILLTWEYDSKTLNGVPNETRIIGTVNGTEVYWKTLKGPNLTNASLKVNKTQRCASYKVRICNSPHLCSGFSKLYQMPTCGNVEVTSTPSVDGSTTVDLKFLIIFTVSTAVVVIIAAGATYLYCQKKRKKVREKLPTLVPVGDHTGDYIPVGQLSHEGEYDSLDKEEQFAQLET